MHGPARQLEHARAGRRAHAALAAERQSVRPGASSASACDDVARPRLGGALPAQRRDVRARGRGDGVASSRASDDEADRAAHRGGEASRVPACRAARAGMRAPLARARCAAPSARGRRELRAHAVAARRRVRRRACLTPPRALLDHRPPCARSRPRSCSARSPSRSRVARQRAGRVLYQWADADGNVRFTSSPGERPARRARHARARRAGTQRRRERRAAAGRAHAAAARADRGGVAARRAARGRRRRRRRRPPRSRRRRLVPPTPEEVAEIDARIRTLESQIADAEVELTQRTSVPDRERRGAERGGRAGDRGPPAGLQAELAALRDAPRAVAPPMPTDAPQRGRARRRRRRRALPLRPRARRAAGARHRDRQHRRRLPLLRRARLARRRHRHLHAGRVASTARAATGSRATPRRCWRRSAALGHETWFRLGDRDFAHCHHRTLRLAAGARARRHRRRAAPRAGRGDAHPADVGGALPDLRRRCAAAGACTSRSTWRATARPTTSRRWTSRPARRRGRRPGVLEAIAAADAILLCPSNPVVSIGPILALRGVREALARGARARRGDLADRRRRAGQGPGRPPAARAGRRGLGARRRGALPRAGAGLRARRSATRPSSATSRRWACAPRAVDTLMRDPEIAAGAGARRARAVPGAARDRARSCR